MQPTNDFEQVLAFWFGPLDEQGRAAAAQSARWWKKDPAFDAEVRATFGPQHEAIVRGDCEHWLTTARGRLAYIVVLDQLSRNIFRGTAQAFSSDALAQEVAAEGVGLGMDRALAFDERSFFYMPFMHSEAVARQNRAVELFTAWRDELTGEPHDRVAGLLRYAEQHRDIIQRFGRFPHRNLVLNRTCTGEEIEFLKQPGSSF